VLPVAGLPPEAIAPTRIGAVLFVAMAAAILALLSWSLDAALGRLLGRAARCADARGDQVVQQTMLPSPLLALPTTSR